MFHLPPDQALKGQPFVPFVQQVTSFREPPSPNSSLVLRRPLRGMASEESGKSTGKKQRLYDEGRKRVLKTLPYMLLHVEKMG